LPIDKSTDLVYSLGMPDERQEKTRVKREKIMQVTQTYRVLNMATAQFIYVSAPSARLSVIVARGEAENPNGVLADWILAYDDQVTYGASGLTVACGDFATGVN